MADLILHNGKIVTVDAAFHVVSAIAVKDGRITATGAGADVLKVERSARTKVVDLGGTSGRAMLMVSVEAPVAADRLTPYVERINGEAPK
jgi:hypothetical protein